MSLCSALLEWSHSAFKLDLKSSADVSDGVNPAKILNAIDENHFNAKWMSSIKVVNQEVNELLKMVHLRRTFRRTTPV